MLQARANDRGCAPDAADGARGQRSGLAPRLGRIRGPQSHQAMEVAPSPERLDALLK